MAFYDRNKKKKKQMLVALICLWRFVPVSPTNGGRDKLMGSLNN